MESKNSILGYFFALAATAIWSGNFILARNLNETISPINLAFLRWVIAIIIFLPFAYKHLISDWKIIKDNYLYLSATSLMGITVFNTLIYFAAQTTTAINLTLIALIFPVFIVILSRFFLKELFTIKKTLGILIVIIGVVLLITNGKIDNLFKINFVVGDLLMLLATFSFSIYTMLMSRKPKKMNIRSFQITTFILGLLFLSPFFLWETINSDPIEFNLSIILSLLYIGIFSSFFAFILWSKAVTLITPSKAGMIYYTLPLFSGFLAFIFLNENITLNHLYSSIFIISGILIANYKLKKE